MDKFVEDFKKSVNKSDKSELAEIEQENPKQYDERDCLGLSRLKSYRNLLRFPVVSKDDSKVI